MSKSNFGFDRLRTGVPELFQKDCPVEAVKTYGVKVPKAPHYKEEREFYEALRIPLVNGPGDLPLAMAVEEPGRMSWEHDGQCQCGSRTYLFGQCFKCLKAEIAERNQDIVERAVEQDQADPVAEGEDVVPTGSVRGLGDPLPVLPIAQGGVTRAVLFVNGRMLDNLIKGGSGPRKNFCVQTMQWEPGKDLKLPTDSRGGPYRMAMVQEDGSYLPLQQCVQTSRETQHTVTSEAWFRDPHHLREWELEPAVPQLRSWTGPLPSDQRGDSPPVASAAQEARRARAVALDGPLRAKLRLSFRPMPFAVVIGINF